jgi:hypothetical protein
MYFYKGQYNKPAGKISVSKFFLKDIEKIKGQSPGSHRPKSQWLKSQCPKSQCLEGPSPRELSSLGLGPQKYLFPKEPNAQRLLNIAAFMTVSTQNSERLME